MNCGNSAITTVVLVIGANAAVTLTTLLSIVMVVSLLAPASARRSAYS